MDEIVTKGKKGLNKGEWAEIYALGKLLSRGVCAHQMNGTSYLRDVLFVETGGIRYFPQKDKIVRVESLDGEILAEVSSKNLSPYVFAGFREIAEGKGSFDCNSLRTMAKKMRISSLKSPSNKKDDLLICFNGDAVALGYSVKFAGAARSAILNASGQTHIIYKIESDKETDELNKMAVTYRDGVKRLFREMKNIEFCAIRSDSWASNMEPITSKMLASLVVEYYRGRGCCLKDILSRILESKEKRMGYSPKKWRENIGDFLYRAAYKEVPGKEGSSGTMKSGGLIIVRKNGDLICRPWTDDSENMEYLFDSAEMDTPSRSRHDCCFVYPQGTYPFSTFCRDVLTDSDLDGDGEVNEEDARLHFLVSLVHGGARQIEIPADYLYRLSKIRTGMDEDARLVSLKRTSHKFDKWKDVWVSELPDSNIRYINIAVGIRVNNKKIIKEVK